jgi:hypothetical protein
MTKKTMTATNAAAAKRALKQTPPVTVRALDGGKPKAIKAATKKAADTLKVAAKKTPTATKRVKAVKEFQKLTGHEAVDKVKELIGPASTAVKKDEARAQREESPIHAAIRAIGLPHKLALALRNADDFLMKLPVAQRREAFHLVNFLEQWYALIDREIKVPNLSETAFIAWIDEGLRAQIAEGEYAKLTFADGRRGIALGTHMYPVVLYPKNHDFAEQMASHNPAFFREMVERPEFLPKLAVTANIPAFLSCLFTDGGGPMTVGMLFDVFGNPMSEITPGGFQYNLAVKMAQARDCLSKPVGLAKDAA